MTWIHLTKPPTQCKNTKSVLNWIWWTKQDMTTSHNFRHMFWQNHSFRLPFWMFTGVLLHIIVPEIRMAPKKDSIFYDASFLLFFSFSLNKQYGHACFCSFSHSVWCCVKKRMLDIIFFYFFENFYDLLSCENKKMFNRKKVSLMFFYL